MGIIKLNGTEYTSINVQDVLVGGSSVVDPVTKVANVTVPTKTSDLTNDSGFITDDDLIPTDESAVDEFTTLNGGLLQECVVKLEPVQSGSGTPAPDNVRPISGHTEVDVLRCGKNKLQVIAESKTQYGMTYTVNADGSISVSGTPTGNAQLLLNNRIPLSASMGNITLSGLSNATNVVWNNFVLYDSNGNVTATLMSGTTYTKAPITFDISSYTDTAYGILGIKRRSNDTACSGTVYPQIEIGTSATDFEPYKGNLYQIQIGQTVYGGSLDVLSGVLTVDRGFVEYDGSSDESWAKIANEYRYNIPRPSDITILSGAISNEFKYHGGVGSTCPDGSFYVGGSNLGAVKNDTITLADWKTWLSSSPFQICYELALPFTIQLTPQQISTLIGKNYMSAPLSGQSIDSIEYRDVFGFDDVEKATSVKVPISLLGTDEFTSTASKAYSAGDYFYKDGMMCKALTSIAKGATLTLNTNYSASTLADILKILSQ